MTEKWLLKQLCKKKSCLVTRKGRTPVKNIILGGSEISISKYTPLQLIARNLPTFVTGNFRNQRNTSASSVPSKLTWVTLSAFEHIYTVHWPGIGHPVSNLAKVWVVQLELIPCRLDEPLQVRCGDCEGSALRLDVGVIDAAPGLVEGIGVLDRLHDDLPPLVANQVS